MAVTLFKNFKCNISLQNTDENYVKFYSTGCILLQCILKFNEMLISFIIC